MPPRSMPIVPLSEMTNEQEADLFALMTSKQELTTRDGKPYFKVAFRDARREVSFPVWGDSAWAVACRDEWSPGAFYKIRAVYRETSFGPQLEIRKIRETVEADAADGFDPGMCLAQSRFEPGAMFDELLGLVRQHVAEGPLRTLIETIWGANRAALLRMPAARRNHHTYVAGLLEHTLAVTRNCVYLAERYAKDYPDMKPPLDKALVVAGGALHDVGKILEYEAGPTETHYTAEGALVGHILLGRDMVREAAVDLGMDADRLLRLEHLILSHQRLPEWGSPKPPMTPEALLVHYADDVDAKFNMMAAVLANDTTPGPLTGRGNPLHQQVFRGKRD
ncbi:MAG TPA: HD domain-containing protein [Thermoguttaceae bacterium]|nr:HD domain-containing protein [Thermoguttaceae bacterium]